MSDGTTAVTAIPRALDSYPSGADRTLAADLAMRVQIELFNAIATGVFVLAILHTFGAARFARRAHRVATVERVRVVQCGPRKSVQADPRRQE